LWPESVAKRDTSKCTHIPASTLDLFFRISFSSGQRNKIWKTTELALGVCKKNLVKIKKDMKCCKICIRKPSRIHI